MDEFVIPELSDSYRYSQRDGSDPGLSNGSTASSWSIVGTSPSIMMNRETNHSVGHRSSSLLHEPDIVA